MKQTQPLLIATITFWPFLGHSRQIHWRRMSHRVRCPFPSFRSNVCIFKGLRACLTS